MWDMPEFWARQEADEMLRDYPNCSPSELAASLTQSMSSYDGGIELGEIIVADLKRRAAAGVRFWTGPTALSAAEAADGFGLSAATCALVGQEPDAPADDDEIPWW